MSCSRLSFLPTAQVALFQAALHDDLKAEMFVLLPHDAWHLVRCLRSQPCALSYFGILGIPGQGTWFGP